MSAEAELDLIRRVLERNRELFDLREDDGLDLEEGRDSLSEKEIKVFNDWLKRNRELSERQAAWLHSAAARLGVVEAAPAENVFSSLTDQQRLEHLRRAERVTVNSGPKVLKPPGRR